MLTLTGLNGLLRSDCQSHEPPNLRAAKPQVWMQRQSTMQVAINTIKKIKCPVPKFTSFDHIEWSVRAALPDYPTVGRKSPDTDLALTLQP